MNEQKRRGDSPAEIPFVRWVKEPPPTTPKSKNMGAWIGTVGILSTRPGQWALVAEQPTGANWGSPTQTLKRFGCECAIRGGQLYARFVQS